MLFLAVVAIPASVPAAGWRDFLTQPLVPVSFEAEAASDDEKQVPAKEPVRAEPPAAAVPDTAAAADDGGRKDDGPCAEDLAECREALARLRADALAGVDLDIRVAGKPGNDYPCECRLEGETFQPRQFATTMFTWKAAGYCHKPLYFEDWMLERYGHSHGLVADSFTSAAHFFTTLPVLPYKMGVELPWECVYPLGYYRPGSCAPWTIPAVPISIRGFAVEAATITGIVFLLP